MLNQSEKTASDQPGAKSLAAGVCRYRTGHDAAYAWRINGQFHPVAELTDETFPEFDFSLPREFAEPIDPPSILLPPTPPGEKIICIGLNYRDHAIETGADIPTEPVVFSKFNSTRIGHGESIVLPPISNQVDYEAELVVVIGSTTKQVDASRAMNHVLGYTAGHDVSARDWQKGRPGGQWLAGKSFDTFAPLGPVMVPVAEFGDASNVRVQMHVNGETLQDSSTSQLIFSIAELISHLSNLFTLRRGDLIFTGTPPGVGAARNPPRFLQSGDQCVVEVDKIGRLVNPVSPG